MGGIDTIAITVVWAIGELARNPKIMTKNQDEVRSHVRNNGSVKEDDLDQLPYLKMIVKETLKLHPRVPLLLVRKTLSHFKMNGYHILPKTPVQANVWTIGSDPKY